MNGTAFGTAARTAAIGAILVIAAALGLVVGNALNGIGDRSATTNAGYPAGYQGGAAIPGTRTAAAAFSLDAIAAVQAARGDVVAARTIAGYPAGYQGGAAAPASRTARATFSLDALDALRATRGEAAPDFLDYGLRHGVQTHTEDGPEYIDYVDQARQRSAANKGAAPEYIDYGLRH